MQMESWSEFVRKIRHWCFEEFDWMCSTEVKVLNCPYCGNEMTKGYIQGRDDLGWSEKKRKLALALAGSLAEITFGRTVVAYCCRECKKILIDCADCEE